MRTLKKALSVFLCVAMMFTTLCFFPILTETKADAAVVNTGNETAFYVPETIYLYPDVTSWKSAVKTPFQYYVNNTVDVNDIYSAPVADANLDSTGKIYFAAQEGMSDVELSVKYIDLLGNYMPESNYGSVSFTSENMGDYYLFTVTDGVAPELQADTTGCYIEWCLTYKTALGEEKAVFNYSHIYKPYVIPYGAVARMYNIKGNIIAYGQHITWVTGYHSIEHSTGNLPAQTNTQYPYYMPLKDVKVSSEDSTDGKYSFSPFLSKDNKAYVGGTEVSGEATVQNGSYNAVFSGSDVNTAYLWAGQTNAQFTKSVRAKEFFYGASVDNTYPAAFDYFNPYTASSATALTQVTPTRVGTLYVDISRYDNLNEIPNLGVGMMITDVDSHDSGNQNRIPTAQWYVGDATGVARQNTGAYDTKEILDAANSGVNNKFASQSNLKTPVTLGIIYAGAWNREIDKNASGTYTFKGYYESIDAEFDRLAVSANVDLNVINVDKSNLRAAVDRAVSNFGILGVKENWNSYYYDVNYIDPDTVPLVSAWRRFQAAYINACGALGNVDTVLPQTYDEYAQELNSSLDALLAGKGLRVYFDVNHDDIGVNLWINPTANGYYSWNAADETAVINGVVDGASVYYATSPFTPDADSYTISTEQLSGLFSGSGCVVLDAVNVNDSNVSPRKNFDFTGSKQQVVSYTDTFASTEGLKFWTWYNDSAKVAGTYDNFAVRIKIEKGTEKTAYSPVGKIVTGTTYGTLPVPVREGYTFAGWYTDETLTTAVSEDGAVLARILYAKWTPNSYSVAYDNMFNMNEWATTGTAIGALGAIYEGKAQYDAATSSVTITSNNIKDECYTIWTASSYGVEVKPNTEYRFSYTVSGHNGVGQHQAFIFIYADGATVGYGDGKGWADVKNYTSGDGAYYIDFTTGDKADFFRIRLGTYNPSSTDPITVTFSDLKLIEKTDYNLGLNISATEKAVAFNADGYGELATATREGYVFDGWYTADGEEITADTAVKSKNIHVYSSWIPNQYSVAFDGNTGLGGLGMANAQYDTPFELPANYFIKTGYTFTGWATSPDGEAIYEDKEEVSNLTSEVNGSVTLYAVWNANTFTVKYDKNGGEGEMENADIVYDSEVTLPECGFTRTGYTFIGWSLDKEGTAFITDAEYDNLKTEDGEEVTLYAIWSENSYTLSFDMNGGEGEKINPTVYGYEDEVKLPFNVFTKKGYVLSGWSFEKGGEKVYDNGATVNHINPDKNGSVTLYAVWVPAEYTVRFDANTGSGEMEALSMVYDTEKELTGNTFTKEGYHFIGWSTTAGGSVEYNDMQSVKNLTDTHGKEVTLYAVWEINTYTVTFIYRISDGTLVYVPVAVQHGSAATVPSDFTLTPQKNTTTHYVFEQWDSDITNITSDITVRALYPSKSDEAHKMSSSVTDSTCVKVGYTTYFCTACAYKYTEEIKMKDHVWDEGKVSLAPGCTTNGTFVYTCKNGCSTTKAETIDPLGHDFTEFPAKEATCKEEGNIAHKHCTLCEQCFASDALTTAPDSEALTDEQVKISKLPHIPGAEATCDTAQTCTVCNEVLVAALGHTEVYEYITDDATCTKVGTYTEKVTCSVCLVTVSETVNTGTIPHSYESEVTPPTCTEEGYTTYTCAVCGHSYKDETVPENGHTEGEWKVTTAPTCTENGTETNYCAVCKEGWTTRDVDAEGHDSGEWKVTTPAECEKWGIESLCCTKCGAVINTRGVAPKGHGTTREEVTVEPGCESAGRLSKICNDCNKELSFTVIPETGHSPDAPASCEHDSVCENCGILLEAKFGHSWDEGKITKEPTETEEGERTYTCKNDASHTYTEAIPVRVVITVPEVTDFRAPQSGYIGNIHNMITVEEGLGYNVSVADETVIYMDENGNMTALKDGETDITVTTNDGKFTKTFTFTVKTLKEVKFDVRGTVTTVNAYIGDTVTAPEVSSFVQGGFTYRFKAWTVDDKETDDFTVTGDMTFVAEFTSSCDYSQLDKLTETFNKALDGSYNNEDKIKIYKSEIETAKARIEEFKEGRDTRDASEQPVIDAVCDELSGLISKLYPDDQGRLFIVCDDTVSLGSVTEIRAFLSPLNTLITDGIWTSSDETIGFFVNGKFHAVKTGTVTVTVASGSRTASKEITVKGGSAARVIMFDTLVSNVNYIVEGSYIIRETTNMFWAPDAPVHFRLITDGTFEEYVLYMNDEVVYPDVNGVYTIPANSGDVHVRADGLINDFDQDGQKLSFWEMIIAFFNRIAEFFRSLFGMN